MFKHLFPYTSLSSDVVNKLECLCISMEIVFVNAHKHPTIHRTSLGTILLATVRCNIVRIRIVPLIPIVSMQDFDMGLMTGINTLLNLEVMNVLLHVQHRTLTFATDTTLL
jgi:hypothetical protein